MRKFLVGLLVGATLTMGVASAHSLEPHHDAVLICKHLAEDTAAHVHLVDYDPENNVITYQCERNGY